MLLFLFRVCWSDFILSSTCSVWCVQCSSWHCHQPDLATAKHLSSQQRGLRLSDKICPSSDDGCIVSRKSKENIYYWYIVLIGSINMDTIIEMKPIIINNIVATIFSCLCWCGTSERGCNDQIMMAPLSFHHMRKIISSV